LLTRLRRGTQGRATIAAVSSAGAHAGSSPHFICLRKGTTGGANRVTESSHTPSKDAQSNKKEIS